MNEADTCRTFILPNLKSSHWEDEYITEQMVLTPGRIVPIDDRHIRKEGLRPDYVLFIRQFIPIAVVEAKAEYKSPGDGLQQAIQYAEMLGVKFAYSSNGKGIVEHDFITGMERNLDLFPSPDELWGRLKGTFKFEEKSDETNSLAPYFEEAGGKVPRYYQQAAINKALNSVLEGQKRILLTMATGTGKTFVAFQIIWRLWKAKRKKRILYLADRNVLSDQAKDRTFSPMGQALQKIKGRAVKTREVYFALYQALANPVTGENLYEKYPQDFFDLIIVDDIRYMLKRRPIKPNQLELYRILYKAGEAGIGFRKLAEALRMTSQQLSGVLGSLGSRINGTEGLEDKGGILIVMDINETNDGEWEYTIRPVLQKALEEEQLM